MNTNRCSILQLIFVELKSLFYNIYTWISLSLYAAFASAACFSEGFRDSHVGNILDNNIYITLTNQHMLFFLIVSLIVVFSPMFAADKKIGMEELGDTCFYGKQKRKLSKVIASVIYMLCIILIFEGITLLLCIISNNDLRLGKTVFEFMKPTIILTSGQYYFFSFAMIVMGAMFVVLLTLFVSHKSKDSLVPFASIALFCGIEAFFYFVYEQLYLWNLNVFRLLAPYSLLFDNKVPFSPATRVLVIITLLSIILSSILAWLTIRGAKKCTYKRGIFTSKIIS